MELAPYGVTVNAVCPGHVLTPMLRSIAEQAGPREGMTGDEWLAMRAQDCPQKRMAEPWEIAGIIAFLASKDARYINGQAIEADGGMVMA
jgi:NAD(P)-dependent dehydrogenase (short-subunit alcohol dehydrogenase family)